MKYIVKFFLVVGILFSITACNTHPSYIYSSIDSIEKPYKSDPIFLMLPDNATPIEKKVAIQLKNELRRNNFNIVSGFQGAKWVLSFAVNRDSYSISSPALSSRSTSENVTSVSGSTTHNILYTDTVIYMHLFKASEIGTASLQYIWEGSVMTNERVFRVLPHSTLKNLLDQFGKNFNGSTIVEKSYQKDVNRQ